MVANSNTSSKNTDWAWPSTFTFQQQKDTTYRSERTRSDLQLVQSQEQLKNTINLS